MAYSIIQNTFTLGEMDPKLLARVDFEGYYKTARKLRNVVVIPQGGAKRRFGTQYVDVITDLERQPDIVYFTDSTYLRIVDFLFTPEKIFTIVIRPSNSSDPVDPTDGVAADIYLTPPGSSGIFQVTVDLSGTYEASQIPNINFVRAPDRILLLHEDVRPQMLQRGNADNVWGITPQPFIFFPCFDFTVIDNSAGYSTINFTPSATSGNITLTASAAIFTSNHVGGMFYGFDANSGSMRITAVASTTSASGFSITNFTNLNAIRGSRAILQEPLWGDGGGAVGVNPARGWPTVGGFYQGRLIYGAPKTVPNAISVSRPRDFEDFDDSEPLADNGFTYIMTSDGYQKIRAILGSKALIIITNASIFTTNALTDEGFAPGSFFNEQTREGMADLTAQVIDDQILFVENNGRAVKSFVYDIIQSSFQAESASILSPQVINGPVESAVFTNPLEDDGSFYLLVNSDGTMAVYQTDRAENVRAWTLSYTHGSFRDITSVKDMCHVLVERCVFNPNILTTYDFIYRVTKPFNYFEDKQAALDIGLPIQFFVEQDDYIVVGQDCPFFGLFVTVETAPNYPPVVVYEYYNNQQQWVTFTPVDGTGDWSFSGPISWDTPDVLEWLPNELNGIAGKFWIRAKRTAPDLDPDTPLFMRINGLQGPFQKHMYLEKITFEEVMDATRVKTTSAAGIVTGLDDSIGQQMWVLIGGIPHGPNFVNINGQIDLGADLGNKLCKVGLDYKPSIVPAPPIVGTQQGVSVYYPKLIKAMFLDYFESAGLTCRGQEIPNMQIQGPAVDIELLTKTGVFEVPTVSGRDPRVEVEISQYQPLPFTLIGIGYKVDF